MKSTETTEQERAFLAALFGTTPPPAPVTEDDPDGMREFTRALFANTKH